MDQALLEHFCFQVHMTTGIPVWIMGSEKILCRWNMAAGDPDVEGATVLYALSRIEKHPGEDAFLITYASNFVLAGMVLFHDGRQIYKILIGPVRINLVHDQELKRMLQKLNIIGEHVQSAIHAYLRMLPMLNPARFVQILDMVQTAVNQRPLSAAVRSAHLPSAEMTMAADAAAAMREMALSEYQDMKEYWESRRNVLYLVRCGRAAQLKKIFQEQSAGSDMERKTAGQDLRSLQDHFLMFLESLCDTAIEAGVDVNLALILSEQYREHVELAKNYGDLQKIRVNMALHFAACVENLHMPDALSPLVRRAASWINGHAEEKISTAALAEQLHISRAYLSSAFKKEMGIGLVDFINQQKITQAKQYLLFTEYSLAEISSQLSFSSQGYFQKVFKEVTGMTPMAFLSSGEKM